MATPNPTDNPDLWDAIVLAGQRSPGVCTFDQAPKRERKYANVAARGQEGAASTHVSTPPVKFSVSILIGNISSDVDEWAAWDTWKAVLDTPPAQTRKSVGTGAPDDAALADYERQRQRARSQLTGAELGARLDELDAKYSAVVSAAASANALDAASQGLDIYHPLCAGLKPPIVSVKVVGWTEPKPRGDGGAVAVIDFEENRPPTATAGGAVNGSRSGGFSPRTGGFTGPDPNQDLKDEVAALTKEYQSP